MNLKNKVSKIDFIVMDVDGVLTDGRIIYDNTGNQLKNFDVQDGLGLSIWSKMGYKSAIITGKESHVVTIRAKECKIDSVYQGCTKKLDALEKIMKDFNLTYQQICYIGDDLIDLPVMKKCGFSVAVRNARREVKKEADYITEAFGGRGSVREVIEKVLKAKGLWSEVVKRYYS